ncbi:hypothetical protein Pfo_031178 [Paulownia fortunei]|nr:hypothetical protein Pfo_031178 [Paulownia fortunei]
MAAYAAVVSLMNIMEQIQNHTRNSFFFHKKQIESLREKVGFLQEFIEGYSHGGSKEAEVLESQIACAAHAAEDVIETHVVNQILAGSTGHGKTGSIFLLDLHKVIEDMDSIKVKVMKVKEESGIKDLQPTYSMPATSSRPLTTGKNTMVGFDDELIQLMDVLTRQQSSRVIIPIVGMGGIGKTTLAKNVYENLTIMQHFDIRACVTISQQYSMREILVVLLSCLGKQESSENLLHKRLSGRRYLIILDDMWNIEVWNKIKFFFPDNDNRSRIVVTTRQSKVAVQFGSWFLEMNFLDEDKSWKLLCEKAFPQEGCPPELEEIGKKIAKKCKGLPLSIVVIGGLLGKSLKTQEYWENVEKSINSILNSGDDKQCLNILSLSFNYLPAHLKPCFLYMGIFPEDHEIRVSRLIKLWVAEGFLKPNKAQSLEEIAEGYLKDLVDMNLILVCRWGSNGKIKTCNIHDLLRELCLRVAKKERNRERRIVFLESISKMKYQRRFFHALRSASLARSLICEGGRLSFKFRLLRILNVVDSDPLEGIFKQVNLRYLAYEPLWIEELPSSLSLLWNVQTLIIKGHYWRISAPSEIWEMPQLRHLEFDTLRLPDPPSNRVAQQDDFVLRNLQTLLEIMNFRLSEEVCKRIPNIKKLHINYEDFSGECEGSTYYCLHNLGRLHKLESLKCLFRKPPNRGDLLQKLNFPSSLLKLSLHSCEFHWEDLTIIGLLPHLEVLKLEWNSVIGPKWDPVEGEFLRLKFLKISGCRDLIYWTADSSHFPVLENLVLYGLSKLDEIPSGIGEIPTLRIIRLDYCSVSAAISAVKILEEQESLENEGLQVRSATIITLVLLNLSKFLTTSLHSRQNLCMANKLLNLKHKKLLVVVVLIHNYFRILLMSTTTYSSHTFLNLSSFDLSHQFIHQTFFSHICFLKCYIPKLIYFYE